MCYSTYCSTNINYFHPKLIRYHQQTTLVDIVTPNIIQLTSIPEGDRCCGKYQEQAENSDVNVTNENQASEESPVLQNENIVPLQPKDMISGAAEESKDSTERPVLKEIN